MISALFSSVPVPLINIKNCRLHFNPDMAQTNIEQVRFKWTDIQQRG